MPIPLREDFDAAQLRSEARKTKDSGQARRLLALAAIYDGSTRTEAAKIAGVRLQIIRDWVMKFNARGPSGLIAGRAPGQTPRLTVEHRAALARMVEDGPIPGRAWRGALAACRPPPMGARGVQSRRLGPDDEPGIAGHGLSQAFGPAPPSCSGARRDRGF